MPSISTFEVRKDDLRTTRTSSHDIDPSTLAAGQVLLEIDRFALTANNITYAAFGEKMKYWDFYPAADGWGVIPVWGFATVLASAAGGITAGERFYGYFPMASHALLAVGKSSPAGFHEGTPLRQPLSPVYNQYVRCAADPAYDSTRENEQAVLRPLFFTSWLIADFLADNRYFGADAIVLSSASSKTAYGTAHALAQLPAPRPRIIGLTSARNLAFTRSLGCYDMVVAYADIGTLQAERAVYVDMSGDAGVRAAVHRHYDDRLAYSCAVGGTHWENLGPGENLPGPRPQLFFAPSQIKKRIAEWGGPVFQSRLGTAWTGFLPLVARAMMVVESRGGAAIAETYRRLLDGQTRPEEAHILRF